MQAQAALVEAAKTCPRVSGLLRSGDPRVEILDAIRASKPDLVVLGTHGRRWMARAFLGSTSERLVRVSPVPVLTVHAGHEVHESGSAGVP